LAVMIATINHITVRPHQLYLIVVIYSESDTLLATALYCYILWVLLVIQEYQTNTDIIDRTLSSI